MPAPKNIPNRVPATKIFCRIVSFFAVIKISSFMEMIITETVAKWKSLIIIGI